MGFKKWFGKEDDDQEESYLDLTLERMKVGYMVDYDLKTWEVIGCNTYDYDGFPTREWELRSGDEVCFLERGVEDGKVELTLTRRIQVNQIEEPVADTIIAEEDPPQEVHFDGRLYAAVESSAGLFREGGTGEEREFVNWSYEEGEDRVLFISQWGEREFAAYEGEYVEEYQFTDILPGAEE